jgi:hypothetical protein
MAMAGGGPGLTTVRGGDQTSASMFERRLHWLLRRKVSTPLFTVVALAVALSAVLPDTIRTLVCRYTGVAMPEVTCCPLPEREGDGLAQLRGESCCVVHTVHLARQVSERQAPAAEPVLHLASAVVTLDDQPSLVARHTPSIHARAKTPVGPPLLLVKQAFLI